ncbi:hypothetical protein MKX03_029177, partial [Papaver bracteatum]
MEKLNIENWDDYLHFSNAREGDVLFRAAAKVVELDKKIITPERIRVQDVDGFKSRLEGQVRARTEIAPDQRDKYLQRFQQVQQQGHSNLIGVPHLSGGNQFFPQQQNTLLQQFNSQSQSLSPQVGLVLIHMESPTKQLF